MLTECYWIILQIFVGCGEGGIWGMGYVVDVVCLPQTASEMRLWGYLKSLISEPLWKRGSGI